MRRSRCGLALLAALAFAGPPLLAAPQAAAVHVSKVEIVRTAFRITLADGRVLRQDELPGVELALGEGSPGGGPQRLIRIDAVIPDPKDKTGEIILYALSERDAPTGPWRNLCQPDPDGRRLGFPLAGRFTHDGRYEPMAGKFLITCTAGAEGKCVRLGYPPWRPVPGSAVAPREVYNACVRMVRADYAGDGTGTTRNGQPIDYYDLFGIEKPAYPKAFQFEAGWTAAGAVCVRHVRVKRNTSLADVVDDAPWLADRVGPICTEKFARRLGAFLFVGSPP